jgi:hypothetical protein
LQHVECNPAVLAGLQGDHPCREESAGWFRRAAAARLGATGEATAVPDILDRGADNFHWTFVQAASPCTGNRGADRLECTLQPAVNDMTDEREH